jgi:uncharacterized damage-inducible protein DinB
MDLLDRLVRHDAWTTKQLLLRSAELSDEQLDREFDISFRSVRAILLHTIWNMEVWCDLIAGRPQRAPRQEDGGKTLADLHRRLDCVAVDFEHVARSIADRNAWDELFTDDLDNPPNQKTYGGVVGHVITHSMHHRAQILYLLRLLGLKNLPEGDVLSWEMSLGRS